MYFVRASLYVESPQKPVETNINFVDQKHQSPMGNIIYNCEKPKNESLQII